MIEKPTPKKIVCLINKVSNSCIPLENFAAVSAESFEKHLIVYQQDRGEIIKFIKEVYSDADFQIHSCKESKVKPIFSLLSLFRAIAPDVVHAHHTSSALFSALFAPLFKFKLIVTAHSAYERYTIKQKVSLSLAFLVSSLVICNSRNTALSLPFFIRRHKRRVIYNGVDFTKLDRYSLPKENRTSKVIRVGSVCRMIPEKDLQTLVKGFFLLNSYCKGYGVELVLVGDGPEKAALVKLVNELEISGKVMFLGELSRKKTYQELSAMDIFVVSSRYEGFCNAMVEAGAVGKAIVASNIDPLPEVIGVDSAYFFNVGDEQSLFNALRELVYDHGRRALMGDRAKRFVRASYSLENSANNHKNVYTRPQI